ncbi:CHAT domain-containing protein [Bradyrhizobium sp. SZCCHNRI20481]|uniref:CHAT domain-containing protein n=1 Tax=Bradyrhizobium sp. SZCCHNRI20481 TaxID=3057286 RepID=UPI002916C44A|nr:CHAT domain-containing protein [Bradyrhizobium sp. SZCCHNRI20481]
MPVRQVPGSDLQYVLIAFDATGQERREADGSLASEMVVNRLQTLGGAVTDILLLSHGWMGDVPAAIEQYDRWLAAMAALEADRLAAARQRPGFAPVIIGLHWPSLPFGDETLPSGGGGLLSADTSAASLEAEVERYAARIADTPAARADIRSILEQARIAPAAATLPDSMRDAYLRLFAAAGLTMGDASGRPGAEQDRFDPSVIVSEARSAPADATAGTLGLGDDLRDALLAPLRILSFWKMKDRARQFGEAGAHDVLVRLQQAAPTARIHLMGHSFGCIVVSAAVAGTPDGRALPRPVETMFLVQGALSLWCYAESIPQAAPTQGYFRRTLLKGLVRGAFVTTRSSYDRANGWFYPLGARLKQQYLLDTDYPLYGAIGSFGVRGTQPLAIVDMPIQDVGFSYNFGSGRVYNIEASRIIRNGGGAAGAHSDIAHPEVAHAFWAAILAAPMAVRPQPGPGGGLLGSDIRHFDQQLWRQRTFESAPFPEQVQKQDQQQVEPAQRQQREQQQREQGQHQQQQRQQEDQQQQVQLQYPQWVPEPPVAQPPPFENRKAYPPGEQRWINAGFEDLDAPLKPGQWYTFAFDVDIQQSGVSSVPLADEQLFPEGTSDVTLTIQLDSDDFELSDKSRPLRLPRTGKSRNKARFDLSPKKFGPSALRATVHKDGNFVQQMDLVIDVGAAPSPRVEGAHGRPYSSASVLNPRDVGLSIMPIAGGYDCLVWKPVTVRARLPLLPDYLAKSIEIARQELMKVVTYQNAAGTFVFQSGIDIADADRDAALRIMARAGAALFTKLFFGPAAAQDSKDIGEFLRKLTSDRSRRLKLQIVAEATTVPWGLLYVGDASAGAKLDWDNFIGMRHVIEQIPMQNTPRVSDCLIPSDKPELSISVNVNDNIDRQMGADLVAQQQRFWVAEKAARRNVHVVSRTTSKELVKALADETTNDQILYLYCHARATGLDDPGGPDGSSLVLTDAGITLGELSLDAPTSKLLPGNPLVFINACESAELSPAFYDGFVPYFMAKGARGVVGTECKTPATFATAWAKRFFESFLDGVPLGETFLSLRREFLREHGNPLGLLYAVHCDGDTQVAPSLPRLPPTTPAPNVQPALGTGT